VGFALLLDASIGGFFAPAILGLVFVVSVFVLVFSRRPFQKGRRNAAAVSAGASLVLMVVSFFVVERCAAERRREQFEERIRMESPAGDGTRR
jgi:hypothetical protein